MDFHEDDDAEFFDFPDLNSRTWRHPSEVAAGLAATAPPQPVEESDTPNRRQPHLVGAVVAAAMCTMGLVFGGVLQPGTMLKTQTKQVQLDPALGLTSDETYSATQSTEANSPMLDSLANGLFTGSGTSRKFVARYVIVDGTILTSASAIEGRHSLFFRLNTADSAAGNGLKRVEIPVQVLRLSPKHDLAVLALPEQIMTPLPEWSPETNNRTTDNTDVSMDDCSDNAVDGKIKFTNVAITSTSGVSLDGLVQTSMPALDCAAGSPITNDEGELVGMVAKTTAPETFFVPSSQLSSELELATA